MIALLRDYIPVGTPLNTFLRDKWAVISLTFLIGVIVAAVFAPWLTPYAEQGRGVPNIDMRFQPPSWQNPMGTDSLGRDVLARILFGARASLVAAFAMVFVAATLGTLLGVVSGYWGGVVDTIIMRVTDVFLAFPPLLLAIALATTLGAGLISTVLAVGLTWWTWYARLVRAQAASIRQSAFVLAARSIGVSELTILRRHVLPNVLTPVLVQASVDLSSAILTVAALSFIGLGVQPPTPDWGTMIGEGRLYLQSGRWWLVLYSGGIITLTAIAFNVVGDALRDALDPHTRSANL